ALGARATVLPCATLLRSRSSRDGDSRIMSDSSNQGPDAAGAAAPGAQAPPGPRERVFLVVVDDSPEFGAALRFASRRAAHTGGRERKSTRLNSSHVKISD